MPPAAALFLATAAAATAPATDVLGLNVRDFGALGNGVWNATPQACLYQPSRWCPGVWRGHDDTQSLQLAIDAAQTSGRALLIPAGHYIITRTLNVSCANEYCSRCPCLACPCEYPVTHQPLKLRGEGQMLTHIAVAAPVGAALQLSGNWLSGSLDKQGGPTHNFTEGHEISDLHIASNGLADYGIFGPGLIRSLFSRLTVNLAVVSGARLYDCFENGFEDVNFNYNPIGIHSSCNNFRVSGSDFHGHSITGILIDSGASIDIEKNCIEGNAGPAIIVAPSTLGYPSAVTVRSNYYESNNARPLVFEGSDGKATAICTDLLINGEHWNQSIARALGGRPNNTQLVGKLGNGILLSSIIVDGNSHCPSGKTNIIGQGTSNCLHYSAVAAVSAAAVSIRSNHLVSFGPPMLSASLLRLGTDSSIWGSADITFNGNTPARPRHTSGEFFNGWWPLVSLTGDSTRENPTGSGAAELPYYSLSSPEVPQRNYYGGCGCDTVGCAVRFAQQHWTILAGVAAPPVVMAQHQRNGRETVTWKTVNTTAVGAIVRSIDLRDNPELANSTIYLAMEAAIFPASPSAQLSLMIDVGNGRWQYSNATSVICLGNGSSKRDEGEDCSGRGDGFVMRSYQATMLGSGVARFAVTATAAAQVQLSGIAIAQIGAQWQSLGAASWS
jgi:hypothetical protein